jgi:hypothetical protein
VLVTRLIAPVAAVMETPAGAVYVPPACPVCVGVADPVAQYGLPAYEMVAVGYATTVTAMEAEVLEHGDELTILR